MRKERKDKGVPRSTYKIKGVKLEAQSLLGFWLKSAPPGDIFYTDWPAKAVVNYAHRHNKKVSISTGLFIDYYHKEPSLIKMTKVVMD